MGTPLPHGDSPITPDPVHTVYQLLAQRMLKAMRVVNGSRAPTQEPDPSVTDWASVVKQLAKQAKRCSKLFYRRVKHSFLSPPAQSTLPVPTRKVQRILQRNTLWSEDAASLVRRVERLQEPPPATLPELRSVAKAAQKTLYPLISPHLHPRQFGSKQGHSPAQTIHTFMHDVDQFDRLEAILAFDSPPKHSSAQSQTELVLRSSCCA